jgi:hypothetical protein
MNRVKKILLNIILDEPDKILIKESLQEMSHRCSGSLGETCEDKKKHSIELCSSLETKTKGGSYSNL